MIVVWTLVSAIAGFILGRWMPASRRHAANSELSVMLEARHDRSARLEELVDAVRTRALWVDEHNQGFTVREQLAASPASITVHVPDPEHVLVATLQLSRTSSLVLPFELALALVDVYGPVTLVVDGEIYDVDGTRDQHALTNEVSSRMTERFRKLLKVTR